MPRAPADAGRFRLDPAQPVFEVASGEVYNAAIRVRTNAWDDSGAGDDEDDDGTASVRFRIVAADDPDIAASAIARFFSPED